MYEGVKYECTIDGLKETLDKYGVAVLPSLLSAAEQTAMNGGMWQAIEYYASGLAKPVRRDNPRTYASLFDLSPCHGGLFQHFSWGHQQYVWDVRQNPKIIEPFANLWGTDDLRTSFDGVNCGIGALMHRPRGIFRNKTCIHTDQRWTHLNFECVQALVTGLSIGP